MKLRIVKIITLAILDFAANTPGKMPQSIIIAFECDENGLLST